MTTNYRTKPEGREEFTRLDRWDEILIEEERVEILCYVLPTRVPLVTASIYGMFEVAKRERVYKCYEHFTQTREDGYARTHAIVAARNCSDVLRFGASATNGTIDTRVAIAKAYRNAIRQSVSPQTINEFIEDWLNWRV